jgi:hypothetical protein
VPPGPRTRNSFAVPILVWWERGAFQC